MAVHPFDALVGEDIDTISFVRDYIELRINYSVLRVFTEIHGLIDGETWNLTATTGANALRRYIGRALTAIEFVETDHLALFFEGGTSLHASLKAADRMGPEALNFVLQTHAAGSIQRRCGFGN